MRLPGHTPLLEEESKSLVYIHRVPASLYNTMPLRHDKVQVYRMTSVKHSLTLLCSPRGFKGSTIFQGNAIMQWLHR